MTEPTPAPPTSTELGVTEALSLLGEVVFVADHNAQLVYLSPSWTDLTGFPVESSLGGDVFEVAHPADRALGRAATALLKAQAIDAIRERARLICADGSERWVEVYARLTRRADGSYCTAGSIRQITAPEAAHDSATREVRPDLVDTVTGPFFTLGPDGTLIYASEEMCALLGLSVPAMRAGAWMSQVHEVDRRRILDEIVPEVMLGRHVTTDVRHVEGPTKGRVFELTMRPLDTGGITTESFIGTLRDVTTLRETQRHSGELAKAASETFDLMQEAFVYFDAEGRAVRANSTALRLLRLEQDEFDRGGIPAGRFQLRKLDGSEFPEPPMERARRDGVAITGLAGGFHWGDGSVNWVTLNYVPLPSPLGESPALFWTFNDITATRQESERKRALERAEVARRNAEMSEREARLLAAVTTRLTRQASYPALAEALQLLIPELVTWCSIDLLQPDGSLKRVARTAEDPELPFPEAMTVHPLKVEDRVFGVLNAVRGDAEPQPLTPRESAILEDIAGTLAIAVNRIMLHDQLVEELRERKAAERALAHERLHLAEQVITRTRELTERNEQLAAANLAKDQFLASMSHELRTPLNAILGMSEAVAEETFGPINAQQRSALDDVTAAGEHLLELISDILDLTRIASSDQVLEPRPSNVLTIADDTIRIARPLADAKQITFTWTNEAGDHPLVVDERRLKQVLVNLVGNAIKFTPEKGTVRVISRVTDGELQVDVHDTGIGIAPEDQERVFQPFVQLDSGLDRKFPGTGLGLPLSRRMVEAMGGTVTVESTIGTGSVFRVRVPLSAP